MTIFPRSTSACGSFVCPPTKPEGALRRDLFAADDEQGTYISDIATLTRLVSDKLQGIADAVRAEGWKWVEVSRGPAGSGPPMGEPPHKRV